MFITIDGGDGCGKSTQIKRLESFLTGQGRTVLVCRDPGSTPLGEAVRGILLDRTELAISPASEMFLFMAARAQMVAEIVRPALFEGKIVIADRFLLSTLVYQGFAGGLEPRDILAAGRVAVGETLPDLTILLDIDPETAFGRLNRPLDRMERKGLNYHHAVRAGFLKGADFWRSETGKPLLTLDAAESADALAEKIAAAVFPLLPPSWPQKR